MEDEFKRLYGSKIKEYVDKNIISSLLIGYGEGVYNRNNLERRNLTLCNKLLGDPELKEKIVDKIVDHGLSLSRTYFKGYLDPETRDKVVLDRVFNILSLDQIVEYSVKFDQEIESQKTQIR